MAQVQLADPAGFASGRRRSRSRSSTSAASPRADSTRRSSSCSARTPPGCRRRRSPVCPSCEHPSGSQSGISGSPDHAYLFMDGIARSVRWRGPEGVPVDRDRRAARPARTSSWWSRTATARTPERASVLRDLKRGLTARSSSATAPWAPGPLCAMSTPALAAALLAPRPGELTDCPPKRLHSAEGPALRDHWGARARSEAAP